MENKTRQELWCHNCNQYVQFTMDLSVDDNYDIVCPNCGHHHYRVVRKGEITEARWGRDTSQQQFLFTYGSYATIDYGSTTSSVSTYTSYSNASASGWSAVGSYTYAVWMDSTVT